MKTIDREPPDREFPEKEPPPRAHTEEPGKPEIDQWTVRDDELKAAHTDAVVRRAAAGKQHEALSRAIAETRQRIAELDGALPAAKDNAERADQAVAPLIQRLQEYRDARDAGTARLLGEVATDQPLLLLPVRIEARFGLSAAGATELWVRIYPDDIQVDTHERPLTPDEDTWGRRLWEAWPGLDEARRQRAWAQLCERFSAMRAAWIVRVLDPDQPIAVGRRAGAWTRPPQTSVLPDRWVVVGYRADFPLLTARSEPVPDTLAVGRSANGSSPLSPEQDARWMVDFEQAVSVGMGLRIALTAEQAASGFDRLLVVGIKASLDAAASAERLRALFDAHRYTRGLALIAPGTPSNNTEASPSGHDARLRDARLRDVYRSFMAKPEVTNSPTDRSDTVLLVRNLGLGAWRMYALSPDQDTASQDAERAWDGALLLPPSLEHSLESAPIEDVLFLRDEMANMAWAVEKAVDSAIGPPADRYEQYQAEQRRRYAEDGPASNSSGQRLYYRLGSEVPDYWIPLVPVRYQGTLRLQRAALPKFERGEMTGPMLPEGRILCPGSRLLVFDEEVPREGVRVTRAYQYTRWSDGSTHLWIGRRKRPGRGQCR